MATDEQLRSAFRVLGRSVEAQVPMPPSAAAGRAPRPARRRARLLVPLFSAGAVAALTAGVVVLAGGPSRGPGEVVVTGPPATGASTGPVVPTPSPSVDVTQAVPTSPAAGPSSPRTSRTQAPSGALTAPTAPTRVEAVADGPTTVVTWAPPASGAGTVTGYLVEALDPSGQVVTSPRVGPDARRHEFASLAAGEYRLRVSALSAAGTGPAATSGTVSVRTAPPAAPIQAPPVPVGKGQVVVAWDKTSADKTGNSPLTGHRVVVYDGSGTELKTVDVPGGDGQFVILTLDVGATYRFRIVAVNAYGGSPPGPLSDPVTVT